jgi:hypothetical protein
MFRKILNWFRQSKSDPKPRQYDIVFILTCLRKVRDCNFLTNIHIFDLDSYKYKQERLILNITSYLNVRSLELEVMLCDPIIRPYTEFCLSARYISPSSDIHVLNEMSQQAREMELQLEKYVTKT